MTLVNLFDTGDCRVVVTNQLSGITTYFSGVLGKGASSDPFHGYNWLGGSEVCRVTVNSDGSVQLDNVSGSISDGYQVMVQPVATLTVDAAQVSDYSSNLGAGNGQSANLKMDSGNSSVSLSSSDSISWTPNPAVFSPLTGTLLGLGAYEGAAH